MATSTKQIQSAVERVNALSDDAVLSPSEIVKAVKNTAIIPSVFALYRHIKRGSLKSVNLGSEEEPRYHVKGKDLKKFFAERYGNI